MLKEKLNFYIIVASASILGIMTDYFFYGKSIGISFFIFTLSAIAFSLIIAKKFEQKLNKIQVLLLLSAITLSASVFLRTGLFLNFFNIIGSFYLLFLAIILFTKKDFFNSGILQYFSMPISFLLRSFGNAAKLINEQKYPAADKEKFGSMQFRGVIKGIIMSLPVLAILGWFLYSADLVVQAYVNKLFDLLYIKINLELILRTLIVFIFSYISIGIFSNLAEKNKTETPETEKIRTKSTGFIESMTVLFLVELLFLAFISIQFFYLFGGKSYVWGIDEYITYSEYAKSGFYELIKVAIVSFLLIFAIDGSSKIETLKEKKIFRFLSAALFVEITLILLSALKRLLLYVNGYGLTLFRFLAFALLFWIFCVFLFFIYKIFMEKKNSVFVFMVFSLTIAVWIGINIINPDALIAKVNIERFLNGNKLDPIYFSNLSEDAVPEIVKIFDLNVPEETKEMAAMNLDWKYVLRNRSCNITNFSNMPFDSFSLSQCKPASFSERIKNIKTKSLWQGYNLSRSNAMQTITYNTEKIEKYEISYWKKAVAGCKDSAMQCEEDCDSNTWQPPETCKYFCNLRGCEEFEKSVKLIQ